MRLTDSIKSIAAGGLGLCGCRRRSGSQTPWEQTALAAFCTVPLIAEIASEGLAECELSTSVLRALTPRRLPLPPFPRTSCGFVLSCRAFDTRRVCPASGSGVVAPAEAGRCPLSALAAAAPTVGSAAGTSTLLDYSLLSTRFAYSALASFRMGMSGSASFQSVRNS
jgi:hypothetical protein